MKKTTVLIAVIVVVLCAFGWIAFGSDLIKDSGRIADYIAQGDAWVEEGLYQRAIGEYEKALAEKPTLELYEKINNAYTLRFAEAPEDTVDAYGSFLEKAVAAHPASPALVDSFTLLFMANEDYAAVYACLKAAVAAGYNTDDVQKNMRAARYAYEVNRTGYSEFLQSPWTFHTVKGENGWNVYGNSGGTAVPNDGESIGFCSEDGYFILTDAKDSRLVNNEGFVFGIFEKKVTNGGLFSDGLVPACVDGVYHYYNEFAKSQFGGYEMAGAFQDGLAAVKKDGKWMLIDTKGEVKSDSFEEIVLDYVGRYCFDGKFLAKANGKYAVYNEKLEAEVTLDCTAVDAILEDGVFAFCKGDKWGFMNAAGETVIQPVFEKAKSFSNGLAAVCMDGLWGFVDPQGEIVIQPEFLDAGYMTAEGFCPVLSDTEEYEWAEPEEEEETTDLPSDTETESTETTDTEEGTDSEASDGTENAAPEEEGSEENFEQEESVPVWQILQLLIGIVED